MVTRQQQALSGRDGHRSDAEAEGNQQAFLRGLAHLYNLVPYQRRAQHAGQCGVEVKCGNIRARAAFQKGWPDPQRHPIALPSRLGATHDHAEAPGIWGFGLNCLRAPLASPPN